MYCTPTSKEMGLPIRDSEAKTRVENDALLCGLRRCNVHLEFPRIATDSDRGTSVTTISVIGFLLLLAMLKFRSCALPAIIIISEVLLLLALLAALFAGVPVTVVEVAIILP